MQDPRASEIITVHPVVLCLVEEAGRYLLIQEAKENCRFLWHLPGGGLQKGEGLRVAAEREAREESGILIHTLGVMSVQRLRIEKRGFDERWRIIVVAAPIGGSLKTQEDAESMRAGWFTPAEADRLELRMSFTRDLIRQHLKKPPLLPVDDFDIQHNQPG